MESRMNNKGFSLVELLIVVAMIAVLVGVLTPHFMKYANNAKVTMDMGNANEMAKLINAEMSQNGGVELPAGNTIEGVGGTVVNNIPGLEKLPMCKLNGSYSWKITFSQGVGVLEITLNDYVIYPNTGTPPEYYLQYYAE